MKRIWYNCEKKYGDRVQRALVRNATKNTKEKHQHDATTTMIHMYQLSTCNFVAIFWGKAFHFLFQHDCCWAQNKVHKAMI